MKLLMISGDRLLASGKQGAFSETLSELCKHFERIDILCPRISVPQHVRVIYGNVHVHSSPLGLWYQPFWVLKKGKELFRLYQHDVVTVHEYPPFYNGIGARMLKRSLGIPTVLEIHHIVGWPTASSLSEWIGRLLSRIFLASHTKHFDAVRIVNGTVKTTLTSFGISAQKLSIVPSVYLDLALIDAVKNAQKKFDLVFAARLADNKGLLEAIRTLVLLPTATMLVIGDGPMRSKAEALARTLGITSRITFAGWLPTARDVLSAIASGRLFIMNSKSEGNPRSAIEAMALGVPVLATRVGIMPDVIEDGMNGVFIDGTSEDLALKADALLQNEGKRVSIGIEAAKIASRFEKAAAIKAYAEFLKSFAR